MVRGRNLFRNRRNGGANGELALFLTPFSRGARWIGKHYLLCLIGLCTLYGMSGITTVKPNEVGFILRMGALVGKSTGDAIYGPGVLIALPRPFDQVVRINASQVKTLVINDLRRANEDGPQDGSIENYLLTADRNVLHSEIRVRYTIDDPVAYALRSTNHQDMLQSAVLAAAVQQTGAIQLDELLGQGRSQFLNATRLNAQERADRMHIGLQIVSVEFNDLAPPLAVVRSFDSVQSANIAALTQIKKARAYAAERVPAARAESQQLHAEATAFAETIFRQANGEVAAFSKLARAYRVSPSVVVERLYREAIEDIFDQAGTVTFVPRSDVSQQGAMHVTISESGDRPPLMRRSSERSKHE